MKISRETTRFHSKASEKYVDVSFSYERYPDYITSIPLEYRRTGTEIADEDVDKYLEEVYAATHPNKWDTWKQEQCAFWGERNAETTKPFFNALAKEFGWCCVSCSLPANPNWARRIQDIKEFGYTLATNTKRHCATCERNTTQIILVPLPRGGITGYETWTPKLRNHIINLLSSFDAFEAKVTRKEGLLPDHKFPEIRWDAATKRDTLSGLDDSEIKRDFQLLSNQRNQQKREVCRNCFQTGNRGTVYGIPFFHSGTEKWDPLIPKIGKEAERGCAGCGWYDINAWRSALISKLKS